MNDKKEYFDFFKLIPCEIKISKILKAADYCSPTSFYRFMEGYLGAMSLDTCEKIYDTYSSFIFKEFHRLKNG